MKLKLRPEFEAECDRIAGLLMQIPPYKEVARKHNVTVQAVRYQIFKRTKIQMPSDETEPKIAAHPEVP